MISMKNEILQEIDIVRIKRNPHQPRRNFDNEELKELAETIKSVGILHPPLVKALGKGEYELISGERRLRAAQLANLTKIHAIVKECSPEFSEEAALIENMQRAELNPIEISKALKSLMLKLGLNQEELAFRLGKKRSTIANYLRLLSLPPPIQTHLIEGAISMGHAKIILSLDSPERQNILTQRIIDEKLSVKETEVRAKALIKKNQVERKDRASNPDLACLKEELQELLGTKVTIQGNVQKGKLMIDYYTLEDLERILCLLGYK
jgi:ParB family chromosome partitioning protein